MFLKLDWESAQSDLPYFIGTLGDICDKQDLAPGIYVIRDTGNRAAVFDMKEMGWEYLMSTLDMQAMVPYWGKLPAVPIEGMATKHLTPAERDAFLIPEFDFFEGTGCANRLYRTLAFDSATCLMTDWVRNSLNGRADRVGIIWEGDTVAGFITLRSLSARTEQVDLLAVRQDYRGKGYGKALALWAVSDSFADIIQVRTELGNSASIRCYEVAGFRPIGVDPLYWARVERKGGE